MLRHPCFLVLILTAAAMANDWPQWQGPDRNAVSKEKGLLQEWPKDGPPLAWKAKELGGGDSAPSVAGGKIFGMSNRGDDEVVWSLSEADGKELWVTRLGPAFQQRVPQSKEGPSCTPTVDGEQLYVLGVGGDLAELLALHSMIDPADDRPFVPHVTLARLRGTRPREVARFLQDRGRVEIAPFLVSRIAIFSARAGTGGGPYAVEETIALGSDASDAGDADEVGEEV